MDPWLSFEHMDQSHEVVREAKPYLTLLGLSIIPLMIFMTFKQFAEGLGFTKQAMMISLLGQPVQYLPWRYIRKRPFWGKSDGR